MVKSTVLHASILPLLAVACATPTVTPVSVGPITPKGREKVAVSQSILLVDSSASVSKRGDFPGEKALLQSLVSSMPNGGYDAGSIVYGGVNREVHELSRFDRAALGDFSQGISHLSEGSPTYAALAEAGEALKGKSGRAAITLLSDGVPSDPFGREVPTERSIEAARQVAKNYQGKLCIHTIQIGDDPAGTNFLQRLAGATGCGSHRNASSLGSASSLQAFQREVYFAKASAPPPPPPPMAKKVPGDRDGDGVRDDRDKCPGTPSGVRVDGRGCWVIEGLNFATNSAQIEAASKLRLDREVVPAIKKAKGIRLRIDGHTDSRGKEAYNQSLSEKRARAVRNYLVSKGVAANRLESRGFGESRPAAPNDTPANLRKNRRTEITVLGQE